MWNSYLFFLFCSSHLFPIKINLFSLIIGLTAMRIPILMRPNQTDNWQRSVIISIVWLYCSICVFVRSVKQVQQHEVSIHNWWTLIKFASLRWWWLLRGIIVSALDHRSLSPEFESLRGNIWRVFHLWLRFITFGSRSAHLAYNVHKSGRKTSIIIITITIIIYYYYLSCYWEY